MSERKPVTHRWPDPSKDEEERMANGLPVPGPVAIRIKREVMINGQMALPDDIVTNVPHSSAKALASRERGYRAEIIEE